MENDEILERINAELLKRGIPNFCATQTIFALEASGLSVRDKNDDMEGYVL